MTHVFDYVGQLHTTDIPVHGHTASVDRAGTVKTHSCWETSAPALRSISRVTHEDVSPFSEAKSIVIYGWDGMLKVQLQQNGERCTEGMDSLTFILCKVCGRQTNLEHQPNIIAFMFFQEWLKIISLHLRLHEVHIDLFLYWQFIMISRHSLFNIFIPMLI